MVSFIRTFTEIPGRTLTEKQSLFSEIILNLNFLTILGCGIEVEVLTEAVYTCSKNPIYKMQLSLRYHKVGEESLTAELVNWLRRE